MPDPQRSTASSGVSQAATPPGQGVAAVPAVPVTRPGYALSELEEEVRPLELVNVLLRRRRIVVALTLGTAFFTGLISIFVPPTYTAVTTFVPEAGNDARLPSGLAGL